MGICIRLYVAENERELNVVVSNDDSKRDKSKENPSKVVADFVVPLSVIPKNETIATVSDEIDWEDVKIERTINENDENEPVPDADDNFVDINNVDEDNDADASNEPSDDRNQPTSTSNQANNTSNNVGGNSWRPALQNVTEFVLPDMRRQLSQQLKLVNRNTGINRQVVNTAQKHNVHRYTTCSNVASYSFESSRQSSTNSSQLFSHSSLMNGNAYNQDPIGDACSETMSSGYSESQSQETLLSEDFSHMVDVNIEESSNYTHHSIFDHSYTNSAYFSNRRNNMIETVYHCKFCSYTCDNKKSLAAHKICHMVKQIVCQYCNASFSCKSSLKSHLREHPETKRVYECEMCPYKATSKHLLSMHRKRHSLPNHVSCSYCGYISKSKSIMDIHERSHTNEKPFSCLRCDFRGVSQSSLNAHVRQWHENSMKPNKNQKFPQLMPS